MTMLLSSQLLPIAALDDVLQVVLPVLFAILYIVGQLLTARKQAPKEVRPPKLEVHLPGDPQGGPGGRGRPDGQGVGEPIGLEGALRKEVDEFLRRTQRKQGKPEKQGGQFGDKPARPRPGHRQPQQASSSRSNRKTFRREALRAEDTHDQGKARDGRERHLASRPLAVESHEQEDRSTAQSTISPGLPSSTARVGASPGTLAGPLASAPRTQSVRAHVTAHIGHSLQAIGQHAESLSDSLEVTSEQTQRRIEQKFDHQVGSMIHQRGVTAAQGPGLTEEVANLLRSPEGIRQLIIANEILNRPVH